MQENKKELIIIAGVAKNNVIGKNNELPWHLKEDLKHFKELTFGFPVIMGRNTYESILQTLGKPLPGRKNIVITSQKDYDTNTETIISHSLQEAIKKAHELSDKAYVIGGQQIYKQALPLADKLEITHIHKKFDGDAYFPEITGNDWLETKREDKKGENLEFSFSTYEKKLGALKPNKGLFIAFEGIDGSGKSTQIRELVQHIFNKSKYHHVVLTRNPYKDISIREILHQDIDPHSQAEKLADLFISDRKQMAEDVVLPNLQKGCFVITDRYKLSTIAYQSTQGLDMQALIDKQDALPKPNLTFIIDVSAEEAMNRMKKEDINVRGKEHKFEASLDFIRTLRENYHKIPSLLKDEKIFIINGERSPSEIAEDIKNIFDKETDGGIKMKQAATLVFYDGKGNFLLQNRKGISKWGEDYQLFGGHIEKGETPEIALRREIKEELGIELNDFKLFKHWPHYSKVAECYYETFVYLAPMPSFADLKVSDGKAEIINFAGLDKIKMIPGYKEILQEISAGK
ncbi:dTMP kinase [Candidatus Pacearchaeota archaeon CG_4_9_14_0_2_um_filter_39_13]|nr:dTMP kinase [Candidatus Pacearchaeota archaeon]OIO42737.1 MAG: dTMP kinase [Candidatus Pacearchaeota archaeon CG1_02_39_14]PJC44292.1 MAG: dTMP kinase [Candidatus Pacearchaeota archaeon CG_4_9_14_0_2_um_filter_39_13]